MYPQPLGTSLTHTVYRTCSTRTGDREGRKGFAERSTVQVEEGKEGREVWRCIMILS